LSLNAEAIRGILPDVVVYMDIDVNVALSRTFDVVGDKWEKMGKDFFLSIIRGYEKCEKLDIMKNRFIRIDANRDKEAIFDDILSQLHI
jgi:thymidylate kinase